MILYIICLCYIIKVELRNRSCTSYKVATSNYNFLLGVVKFDTTYEQDTIQHEISMLWIEA